MVRALRLRYRVGPMRLTADQTAAKGCARAWWGWVWAWGQVVYRLLL